MEKNGLWESKVILQQKRKAPAEEAGAASIAGFFRERRAHERSEARILPGKVKVTKEELKELKNLEDKN